MPGLSRRRGSPPCRCTHGASSAASTASRLDPVVLPHCSHTTGISQRPRYSRRLTRWPQGVAPTTMFESSITAARSDKNACMSMRRSTPVPRLVSVRLMPRTFLILRRRTPGACLRRIHGYTWIIGRQDRRAWRAASEAVQFIPQHQNRQSSTPAQPTQAFVPHGYLEPRSSRSFQMRLTCRQTVPQLPRTRCMYRRRDTLG
jgi:hypothetical protein